MDSEIIGGILILHVYGIFTWNNQAEVFSISVTPGEALPGLQGTKELGHEIIILGKRKIKLGTRKKVVFSKFFGNRKHQNREDNFKEQGNTNKILLGTSGTWTPPPPLRGPPW